MKPVENINVANGDTAKLFTIIPKRSALLDM